MAKNKEIKGTLAKLESKKKTLIELLCSYGIRVPADLISSAPVFSAHEMTAYMTAPATSSATRQRDARVIDQSHVLLLP